MKEFLKIFGICFVLSALILLGMEWLFSTNYLNQKAEAGFMAPVNITAGCKGKEKVYDYQTLKNTLSGQASIGTPIDPCLLKAYIWIVDMENIIKPYNLTNFNKKTHLKFLWQKKFNCAR